MFVRSLHPERLLRALHGTQPFLDYCRLRDIRFVQMPDAIMRPDDYLRWTDVLREMDNEKRLQIEVELAKVNELSDANSIAHLTKAIDGSETPPDVIPDGPAVALWFLLRHPEVFHEVLLREEIGKVESWRTAQAPANLLQPEGLPGKAAGLAELLQKCFRQREGSGRFCVVEVHHLREAYCFVAYLADRVQFFDTFSDTGKHKTQRLRPAFTVSFVYYPTDGTVLFRARVRSVDRILELLQYFGKSVLGVDLGEWCLATVFNLDKLKQDFHPLPDAEDMEMIRIKAIHLNYPERHGRRRLKLETRTGDETAAIPKLLQAHVGSGGLVAELHVSYAELQIGLRLGNQFKRYVIRLWPNRCNLSQTALGERFRTCLKRWGLLHVRQS
jgi:hypothetical protein